MKINLINPAIHPANGSLTVEGITRLIAEMRRSLEYQNGGDMAYVIADTINGLEELLERRKAEQCDVNTDDGRSRQNRGQKRNRERMRKSGREVYFERFAF